MAAHDGKMKATMAIASADLGVLSRTIAILEDAAEKNPNALDDIDTPDIAQLVSTLRKIMGDVPESDMHRLSALLQQNCRHAWHHRHGFVYTLHALKEHILLEIAKPSEDLCFFTRTIENLEYMLEEDPETTLMQALHANGCLSASDTKRLSALIKQASGNNDKGLDGFDLLNTLHDLKYEALVKLERSMGPCKKRKVCH